MSESSAFGFGQFVPGFDFLQNLSKTAAQAAPAAGAVPGMASWVAPTLSVEELDKRIQELKAVQFWLDQNATALKATIQAMEVQKMTLSTLQSMNVNMADLAKAFTVKPPATEAQAAAAPEEKSRASIFSPKTKPTPEPVIEPEGGSLDESLDESLDATVAEEAAESDAQPKAASDKPAVDPMQWWGALTQQFQGIAAAAMKDVASEAMKAGMAAQNAAATGIAARNAGATAQSKTKTKTKTKAKARSRATGAVAAQPAAKKVAKPAPAAHKSSAQPRAKSSAQTATNTAARSSRPAAPKRAAK